MSDSDSSDSQESSMLPERSMDLVTLKRDSVVIDMDDSESEYTEELNVTSNVVPIIDIFSDTEDPDPDLVELVEEEPRAGGSKGNVLSMDQDQADGDVEPLDSQDDAFLAEIPDDMFQDNDPSTAAAAATPSSSANESALKWLEKMRLEEEKQKEVFNTLTRFSSNGRISPEIRPSHHHTVAFVMTSDYKVGDRLKPYPRNFVSKWDQNYVPMPCCDENVRYLRTRTSDRDEDGQRQRHRVGVEDDVEKVNIWERVTGRLETLTFSNCQDIFLAMRYYLVRGGPLNVLEHAIEKLMSEEERSNFYEKVLPFIAKLCLALPKNLTSPLPLLTRYSNHSISLSQTQIASLLANAFFATFPKRWKVEDSYPSINLNGLFSSNPDDLRFSGRANKVRCILHYFERLEKGMPCGVVTFTRKAIPNDKFPEFKHSTKPLAKMVVLSKGTIETEGTGTLQVDFANRYLGGGVLGDGAVQEEILFVVYPEMIVSRLFTENMSSTEAVLITGCERFSKYHGYARTFTYAGDFIDLTPADAKGRRRTQFTCIDALYIRNKVEQFHPKNISRELKKAYVGFCCRSPDPVAISTGKWGCGAFNGDPELKTVIQYMAASEAQRDLIFFTFGDTQLQDTMISVIEILKDKTVQDVWKLLSHYYSVFCATGKPKMGLGRFLLQFGQLGVPDDKETEETETPKLHQVPVTKFYSTVAKSSSNVNSNFPKPMENPNVKVLTPIGESVNRNLSGSGWISVDTNKSKSTAKHPLVSPTSSATATNSSKDKDKGHWVNNLESLKSTFQSKKLKSGSSTSKEKEEKSSLMTEEDIAAQIEQMSEEMDCDVQADTEAQIQTPTNSTNSLQRNLTQEEYKNAFRPSPIVMRKPDNKSENRGSGLSLEDTDFFDEFS